MSNRTDEGRDVQQELERQLRAFGDTVSDAWNTGFEGRGQEIGDRAWDVGRAAADAAGYGINEAGRTVREMGQKVRDTKAPAGSALWLVQGMLGIQRDPTPVEAMRQSAGKCRNTGIALFVVGLTFAITFGMSAVGCFLGAGIAAELLSFEIRALNIIGWLTAAVTAGFGWMVAAGLSRMKMGKVMKQYADAAESVDVKQGIPVQLLADSAHQTVQVTRQNLQKMIRKEWLTAWLSDRADRLFLSVEDYSEAKARQAEQERQRAAAEKQEAGKTAPMNLETVRRFADVLGKQKYLMEDERAAEELEQMQKTTQAICDWLEQHPESIPKTRRFAEYYIPTTLKLLHTYNDVRGQQGENANNIRRDIAGILHTLNQAYQNLYDNLLSDTALDISGEIAALQGMLANDGLTGEEMKL